ncbi:PLDc N-terminal domain-containing protein [Rhodobacter capsulatus]|uniref:PLDc N-terminal domain-containing protein n=1 Tax=Rhodobacter capsulatus TaxID=1061 RepID=UPI004027DF9B
MDHITYTGLGGLLVLVLDLWALISVLGSRVSTGKKLVWVLLILVLPLLGFFAWLLAGPRAASASA